MSLLLVVPTSWLLAGDYVIGWGINISGQSTGLPTDYPYATGTVMVAGTTLTEVEKLTAGLTHALALKTDQTVVGWGNNMGGRATGSETVYPHRANGLVTIGKVGLADVLSLSAWQQSLALKNDGSVVCWGGDGSGREWKVPERLREVISISAGPDHNLALTRFGKVFYWTESVAYEVLDLSNVTAIAACRSSYGKRVL
jgi:alpha-tubulin suppressor-like RCC1 family protein